jgi:hypothetical protein
MNKILLVFFISLSPFLDASQRDNPFQAPLSVVLREGLRALGVDLDSSSAGVVAGQFPLYSELSDYSDHRCRSLSGYGDRTVPSSTLVVQDASGAAAAAQSSPSALLVPAHVPEVDRAQLESDIFSCLCCLEQDLTESRRCVSVSETSSFLDRVDKNIVKLNDLLSKISKNKGDLFRRNLEEIENEVARLKSSSVVPKEKH